MRRIGAAIGTVVLLAILGLPPVVQAVMPRPSWDVDAVGKTKRPKNASQFVSQLYGSYAARPLWEGVDGLAPVDAYLSRAYLEPPLLLWADLNRSAKSQKDLTAKWKAVKDEYAAEMQFRLTLVATRQEYAALSNVAGGTAVYLEDDLGRRFEPREVTSGSPWAVVGGFTDEGEDPGSSLTGWALNSLVVFPAKDPDGRPIIDQTTRFVRLVLECGTGRAWFTYPFADGVEPPAGEAPPAGFEYTDFALREEEGVGQVTGRVVNATGQDCRFASFTIAFRDAGGLVVAAADFAVGNLPAGASSPFTVIGEGPFPAGATWEIRFNGGY